MAGQTNYSTMVKILLALMIASATAATEETKGTNNKQGRQLNWNDGPSSAYHTADPYLASASSVMSAQQSKPSSYDAAPDQDISRDSAYSAGPPSSSYYPTGSDYGYEAAPSDTASYTGNSATSYGYYSRYPFTVPTTSRPFYTSHDRQDSNVLSPLSGLQSGKIAYFPLPVHRQSLSGGRLMASSNNSSMATSRGGDYSSSSSNAGYYSESAGGGDALDPVNRALYDEDNPLGGVASKPLTSSTSLLGSTTLRNVQSRQDEFGYGNGLYSLPPAGAYDGAYGGYGGSSYYGAGGGFGYPNSYGSSYGAGYGGYPSSYGGYGAGSYYPTNSYGNYGNSYRNGYGYSYGYGYGMPYYNNNNYGGYGGSYAGLGYGRSPALYNNYGDGGYGYGGLSGWGVLKPHHFLKKLKKAYKHFNKYSFPIGNYGGYGGYAGGGFGGAYGGGYGGNYGAMAPYDSWFYDVPTVWDLGKFALKSVAKTVIKPIYSLVSPFCGPFFYKRSDGLVDEKQNSFVSALTAFLPIGLFLAAIVPNIVTVSAGRRKRSETEEAEIAKEEASFPILDMISTYGARSLQDPKCQTKIVCEMGRMGGTPEANMLQRALWITANYVPESLARMTGTDALLRSIRSQKCSEFKCSSD